MTGNRHHRSGAAAPETGAAAALSGAVRRRFSGAANFVAAAVLVCAGAGAQAQSFYLDDVDLRLNIIDFDSSRDTAVFGVTPRVISGSSIIQNNVTYSLTGSDLFKVDRNTGVIRAARNLDVEDDPDGNNDIRHHSVTLTAEHGGETADLRLTIGVYLLGFSYACDRTPIVEQAVRAHLGSHARCEQIGVGFYSQISEISFVGAGSAPANRTLFDYDFWDMSRSSAFNPGLQDLYLTGANLNRLPPDVFTVLDGLRYLTFYGGDDDAIRNQDLTEFPARLIADLERTPHIRFSTNPGDTISGIRYSLDGAAVGGTLALEEGRRYNLEIEVDGGVRNDLTLDFRSGNQSLITASATVTIDQFSNKKTVVLETPLNLDIGERRVTTMAWAWTQFNRNSRYRNTGGTIVTVSSGAEELLTPGLQVAVANTSGLEDTDPAPNRINEAALPGTMVSGWSPQVLIRSVAVPNARYSLSSDAGGLFGIDAMTGALSLASGRTLSYAASTFHEVTVAAQVTVDGDSLTASLTVPIEVSPEFTLTDADPSANIIASRAAVGAPVAGVTPVARLGGNTVTDGVVYSLDGPGGLFAVNPASGAISSARPFVADDIRAHPVTLTVIYNDVTYGNLAASLPLTIEVRDGVSICDRTRQIRDGILALVNTPEPRHDCNFVPSSVLASVSALAVQNQGVRTLLAHDFDGMTGLQNLDLNFNRIPGLPEDIFRDTASLRVLNLSVNFLTSLPPDIFMNLNSLGDLNLLFNNLTELPARLLADLEKEPPITLGVGPNILIGVQQRLDGAPVADALTLDEGVRHRLQIEAAGGVRSALTLVLRGYRDLPPGVTPTTVIAGLPFAVTPTTIEELPFTVAPTTIEFSPLSDTDAEVTDTAVIELMAPLDLDFGDRQVTTMLWEWRMFSAAVDGAAEIRTQYLRVNVRNTETFFLEDADPSPNTITASAVVGTVVAGVRPVARIGRVGATVAATGAEYALTGGDLFTVNSASGVISLARLVTDGDRGRRPVTLTATYRNTSASLPLVISVLHADGGFDICGRTPVVRDEILRRVNEGGGTLDCTDVPAADMASVQTLDFSANPATVETLRADDFDGLSRLADLNLRALGLRRLPPDIFGGLANLRMLNLQDSRLTSLPARLLPSLEKSPPVTAGFDAGVLIGGVQYRAGGETVTELALDEGARRSLRIEIPGGVRSPLTLVARTDGAPRPVVTPETIRFSPSVGADAAIVELMIPADVNFDGSTGSVSWAWTMFNAAGAAAEIRTQSLRLDVREQDIFEDSNPAPNQINEAAAAGDPVLSWSPRVLVRGAVPDRVRYRLLRDAGGLFGIDSASGALSLVADWTLDYAVSPSHQVTVEANVPGFDAVSLVATIEVTPGFVLRDTDPSVSLITDAARLRTPVGGVALQLRSGTTVLTDGVVYSGADSDEGSDILFEVTTAGLVRTERVLRPGDRGSHTVTLTAVHSLGTASLPLTIEIQSDVVSICDRTPGVREEILSIINSRPGGRIYSCRAVLGSDLASISALNLSQRLRNTQVLMENDFAGMAGLEDLNLRGVPLASLPENIVSNTANLRLLNLRESGLTSLPPDILMNLGRLESLDLSATPLAELPARLLADLERIRPRVLRIDADVRIGGIQYRADGAPITALTLEEGGSSRDLQIEAADGVRSTLTLVFRPGAESGLAAMPTTVRLTPARRMATVTLAVPEDLNVVNRSGPAQWTWRFNPAGADEVAVRAADLQVTVRDTHRFEDTEPAANRISETASPGDEVSGWSPQVVVGGVVQSAVSYSLPSDAGGLFAIHAGNGALSLAPGQALDYAASSAHQVTVVARVTASGATASLAATIEVVPMLFLSDTDSSPNIIFATAAMGTPVAGVALEARLSGDILTDGVTYTLTGSGLFTVNSASGVISAAQQLTEDNTGDYPVTLTATHPRGLPGNLPLTIEVFEGLSVCNRTPVIRDDIMRLVNSDREVPYVCDSVPSARLASITTLNFSGRLNTVTALQADDFAGMTGLENLDLSLLGITAASEASLPEGLFRDTTSLRVLNLRNSRLMPLPPRLLADLERPPRVTAGFDTAAGIGGIQYFVDGAATTGPLTLDGGGSLNLRVEIAGGVHSTLTLVLRADGVALVATPTAVEFGPFSSTNMAVVEWSAPLGLSLADSGGPVFYAWEMFDAAAGGGAEIRAQSLQVNVRNVETLSLEDADPAPNTIAATATAGTNVAGVAPTVRVGAVVVTTGVAYALTGSALFAVHSTSGAIFSTSLLTDANRGRHPVTLTASYRGGESSLPLVIGVHPAGGFDICDRTPVVQEEILYRVNTQAEVRALGTPYRCANIPAIYMASVQTLNFSGYSTTVETLLVHDFEGLSGLTSLNLTSLGLRRLPPAVFGGLANLQSLILSNNNLAPLPPAVFGGLANLQSLILSDNNLAPLPPDLFRGLSRLNILYMRSLGLRSLPPGIFSDLPLLFDLDLSTNNLASLPPNLFGNQPLLSVLSLTGNRLTSLPQDIFSGLINLQVLELVGNDNLVLPARVVADLARQPLIEVRMDRSARIGGIQYRLDGGVVTQLALNEGESRNLQVRVDGGIGSTLTLVARTDGAPPPAVTPPTIRFGPSPGTDTAVVELTARADRNNFGRSTGSVSWAWTMLLDGGAVEVEIRTQSLRLDVFEPVSLEDADPSTNIIAASAVTGTPVGGITPVARIRGVVQTDGVMYSLDGGLADLFAVNTASGVIFAARQLEESDVRARAYPVTLTASHTSGMARLPLDIEVRSGVSICDRTAGVRDEILRIINSRSAGAAHGCDAVPPAVLASIATLTIPRQRVVTLLAHDFSGMPALEYLRLERLDLTGLPEGIFRDTTNLRVLNLAENRLASLPPGIFMNLGQLTELNLGGLLASLPPDIFMNLGQLTELNLGGLATTGLPEVVFSGLPNLRRLSMLESRLASLPPGLLRNLGMLQHLQLSLSDDLTELPAPLLADLEKISPPVFLGLDSEANRRLNGIETSRRIGGIRYRLDGVTTTALTLNEGDSRSLQVEVVGGVRSTLTLVFRTSAESRFTATPPVIRLTASRSTAAVALAAPPDLNAGDRSGPVSWVWASFSGRGLTELPAPDLRITVRDTHRFDDADPAPNRIGETAPAGVAVSGWSPRVLVRNVVATNVRYSLSSDAGGLFQIDTASGALSLAPGRMLNHATAPTYPVTVIAQVTDSGVTGSLAATIEVFTLALDDADPALNVIAATAPQGTPVSGVRPVLLVDGAAVADGVFYTLTGSGLFTVATASGMISSAGALGGAGVHPVTLTATYRGAPAELPLTISVHAEDNFNICDRTPVVQREILYRVNTQAAVRSLGIEYGCGSVPTTRMASIRLLDFPRYSTTVETLLAHDFDGLSGLTVLQLDSLRLRRLPPGIFSGLRVLDRLSLSDNSLTSLPPGIFSNLPVSSLLLALNNLGSLPPGIFSDLSRLQTLDLQFNDNLKLPAQAAADLEGLRLANLDVERAVIPDFRIGGFQYASAPGNQLGFPEGASRNVRLEVPGGVRSTLTLVLRVDGDRRFTVTPTTVRFSPLSNTDTAVVEVAAPVDEEVGTTHAWMSWAWAVPGNLSSAATEIRTRRLLVIVNDDSGLVDTDPADNRISEAASPGDLVSGWLPQLVVDGITQTEVRYRLSSDAGGLFQIHPTSGTLSLASVRTLDYETSTAHTIRVHGQGSGGERPLTTTIFVDNVPELSLSGAVTGSISETAAMGTVVSGIGVLLLDDGVRVPSSDGVVWSLSGAGSHIFEPETSSSATVLRLTGALDYETAPVHTLTLQADYLGGFATTQVTVQVLDAAERLTLEAVGPTPFQIGEGANLGTVVGRVQARDDAGNLLTSGVFYTADGDGKFHISGNGDIFVQGQLDFEASTSHTLFITASYEELAPAQLRVDIVVVDIRNDLQIVDQSSAENIASNTTGGRVRGLDIVFQVDGINQVGTASAWSLPSDAGLFDINSATGVITLREPINFAPADFAIFVHATWTGGDGTPMTPNPLPLTIEINDGVPVRIRVFLEGAVIP